MTEWDNSDIIEKIQMLGTPNKGFFDTLKDSIKTLKTRFGSFFKQGEEQKVLGPGEESTVHSNKTENFASLTPEAMQKFRNGEKEVLQVLQAHKETEMKNSENPEINKKNNPEIDEQEWG